MLRHAARPLEGRHGEGCTANKGIPSLRGNLDVPTNFFIPGWQPRIRAQRYGTAEPVCAPDSHISPCQNVEGKPRSFIGHGPWPNQLCIHMPRLT